MNQCIVTRSGILERRSTGTVSISVLGQRQEGACTATAAPLHAHAHAHAARHRQHPGVGGEPADVRGDAALRCGGEGGSESVSE